MTSLFESCQHAQNANRVLAKCESEFDRLDEGTVVSRYEGLDIYDTDADSRFGAYTLLGQIHLIQIQTHCCTGTDT